MAERQPRCQAQVHRKDTYRVDNRAPRGFSMHYDPGQCSRRATHGDFCKQHAEMPGMVLHYRHANRFMDQP